MAVKSLSGEGETTPTLQEVPRKKSDPGKIFTSIPAIMKEMDAIGKNRKNQSQGFNFRGIDDMYNELHDLLAKHGVFTAPEVIERKREERQTKSGAVMLYTLTKIRFTFYADDGSFFETVVIGEGSDTGDKSSNKSMAVAHKYALVQVFAIPTDEKDPDEESHQLAGKTPAATQKQNPPKVASAPKPNSAPPAATEPTKAGGSGDFITEPQRKRLFTIAGKAQWTTDNVKNYIFAAFGKESTKEITRREYDQLISVIEGSSYETAILEVKGGK